MSFGFQESKAELSAGYWVLSGDPYVMNRAYNTFPDAKRKDGKVVIRATDEAAKDLQWFSSRFPLTIHPEMVMRVSSARYTRDQHTIAHILSEGYVGEPVEFAEGESPRPHQVQAAALVRASKRLLLADGLGVGKTVSALAMIADPSLRPSLVVCPPALEMQWQRSIARFLPSLTVHAIDGTGVYPLNVMKKCQCGHMMDSRRYTKRGKLICDKCKNPIFAGGRNPDVVLCSYSKLMNWAEPLARFAKSVVWEECHALRRNQSQKWEAAKTIAASVPVRLGLSATPLFNYGGEAWNVLECIAPGFLGDKATFRETWCSGYGDAGKEPPLKDPEAFGAYLRTSGVMLRRTAEDVGIKLGQHQRITMPINADANVFNDIAGRAAQLARIILDETKRTRGEQMHASGQLDNLLRQATGLAKCMAKGTLVLMSDGRTRKIEEIKVGDQVMGPGGVARKVLSTTSGRAPMYKVSSNAKCPLFEPYTVNEDHVLALKHSGNIRYGDRFLFAPYIVGDHIEISVKDYLAKSKHFKRMLKGYQSGVDYPRRELPVDPYFLGLWLGDGTSSLVGVTTCDPEIEKYIRDVAASYGLNIAVSQEDRVAPTYYLRDKTGRGGNVQTKNSLAVALRQIGVLKNKHIPHEYLTASREQRLKLLAGLIDTDGSMNKPSSCYTIVQSRKHLADQIATLARSLGFAAKVKETQAKYQNGSRQAFRVRIYGNGLSELPLLLDRKKTKERSQIKDPMRSGITVEPVGQGEYFGFTLDGDGLYLLHDFTVTHNSNFVCDFVEILLEQGIPVVLFGHHHAVYEVWNRRLDKWRPAMYTGQESKLQKDAAVHRFVNGDTDVFICALRSGEGLDGLQFRCCTAVFGELDWTDAVHQQCSGRLYRDGQKHPVNSYFPLSGFGTDPYMAEVVGAKARELSGLMGERASGPTKKIDSSAAIRDLAAKYLNRR